MQHCNKHGEAKILDQCSLPLTGQGVVSKIISKLGIFDIINNTVRIIELAPNISLEEVIQATGTTLIYDETTLDAA